MFHLLSYLTKYGSISIPKYGKYGRSGKLYHYIMKSRLVGSRHKYNCPAAHSLRQTRRLSHLAQRAVSPHAPVLSVARRTDPVPVRRLPVGCAATPLNGLHCMIPARESSVRVERNSSYSDFSALKSDSTVAVPGKTVASPPQNCRALANWCRVAATRLQTQSLRHAFSTSLKECSRSELLP
jgi:hypothetical protein